MQKIHFETNESLSFTFNQTSIARSLFSLHVSHAWNLLTYYILSLMLSATTRSRLEPLILTLQDFVTAYSNPTKPFCSKPKPLTPNSKPTHSASTNPGTPPTPKYVHAYPPDWKNVVSVSTNERYSHQICPALQ